MLAGATRAGQVVSVVRGDLPEVARRRIAGYQLPGAGALLDVAALQQDLADGFAPHPALLACLAGDPAAVREVLSQEYALQLNFVLALTARRELIVKPEFSYVPLGVPPLPAGLTLRPRRLRRDELGLLLGRACGG